MPLSYSDVFNITLEREHEEEIRPGDRVRMGANLHPHYEVVAVNGDKAWVRDVQSGVDHLAKVSRCRKLPDVEAALGADADAAKAA